MKLFNTNSTYRYIQIKITDHEISVFAKAITKTFLGMVLIPPGCSQINILKHFSI